MKKMKPAALGVLSLFSMSCTTTHFNKTTDIAREPKTRGLTYTEYQQKTAQEEQQWAIEEELKQVDMEKSIVYVDRPIYYPEETVTSASSGAGSTAVANKKQTGKPAVLASTVSSIQSPSEYSAGIMKYSWDESFLYEIYCRPLRATDVMLEPGEQVLEMPILSEDKVWEVGAGVSRTNGLDVQHFFLKPSVSGLVTNMIIITDRRVYHLLLKSFSDTYMVMVKWDYASTLPFRINSGAMEEQRNRLNDPAAGTTAASLTRDTTLVDPAYLSFDYKMSHSIFRKPVWLPRRVYDDGRKTYILLDDRVLHSISPILFNQKNERINYRVSGALIIIDSLIEKVTVSDGKDRVVIEKKKKGR